MGDLNQLKGVDSAGEIDSDDQPLQNKRKDFCNPSFCFIGINPP